MNDNEKPIQAEKPALDERKKSALLRYVAIMFAVAFLLVLFSLLGQMRNSMSTISELNQSSSSALQKAEQLQEDNLRLELENQELSHEMEKLKESYAELEAQLADLQKQLEDTDKQSADRKADMDRLQQELEILREEYALQTETLETTAYAYELLLQLQSTATPGDQTGNAEAESLIAELKPLESYLGDTARQTFENLCSRGE